MSSSTNLTSFEKDKTTDITIGAYLAKRLESIGIQHYFSVPGDFNLVLLDELLTNKNLQMIACCNELNAGYAADGYARAKGLAAVVVTFGVGGLSLVNAIAGAYAEDLPIIIISGGPNSNDKSEHHLVHHSTAEYNYRFAHDIFQHITAESVIIDNVVDAPALIEHALKTALQKKKPVYIELACNLASSLIPTPPAYATPTAVRHSDPVALKEAVEAASAMLNKATKPVLVGGVKLRTANGIEAFQQLADASDYGVAIMPNAKSFFPETHPHFLGIYLGQVSTPGCCEVVESADAYLFAGPLFSDYTTMGNTILIDRKKLIEVGVDRVRMPDRDFSNVYMREFLVALAAKLKKNNMAVQAFNRMKGKAPIPDAGDLNRPLTTARLMANVHGMINETSNLLVETGDSWFNGLKMDLPNGARFEIQMQWGSIGWATPATFGHSVGLGRTRRVISLIGDGAFQLTAQEVSSMIRYKVNPIIFLMNNGGYTIEAEIHDGPYNKIKNWDYAGIVNVLNANDGNGFSARVRTESELIAAIKTALMHNDGPSLIECIINKDDCSKQLIQFGSRVGAVNARAPIV